MLIASRVKSNVCIPQTAISTATFSDPNPEISHLEILSCRPEKEANKVDSLFSRKNVVSSA